MRSLKSMAFINYSEVNLTLFGLILFIAVFVGVVIWTGLQRTRQQHKIVQNLPFNDGETHV